VPSVENIRSADSALLSKIIQKRVFEVFPHNFAQPFVNSLTVDQTRLVQI